MKTNISFICPSSYDENGNIRKSKKLFFQQRTLPYLAALTPEKYKINIINDQIEDIQSNKSSDLIVLTGTIQQIDRAIDIARIFKKEGKKVIIGGPGAYALKEYLVSKNIFDSIITCEAEGIWEIVLNDFDKDTLKPFYNNKSHPSLENMPYTQQF